MNETTGTADGEFTVGELRDLLDRAAFQGVPLTVGPALYEYMRDQADVVRRPLYLDGPIRPALGTKIVVDYDMPQWAWSMSRMADTLADTGPPVE